MKNTVVVPFKVRHIYNQQGLPVWWLWCQDTFGPSNNSQYGIPASEHYWRWDSDRRTMWFAKPEHATMFALRWA